MKKKLTKAVAYMIVLSFGVSSFTTQLGTNAKYNRSSSNESYADSTEGDDKDGTGATQSVSERGVGNGSDENSDNSNGKIKAKALENGANGNANGGNAQNIGTDNALDLTNIKYFRSTMYNYDDDIYNKALNKLEIINETVTDKWNGFYFYASEIFNSPLWRNSVSLEQVKPQFDANGNITNLIDGKYVLKSVQADKYVAINDGQLVESDDYIEWNIKRQKNGTYSIKDTSGKTMSVGNEIGVVSNVAVADTYTDFVITKHKQVVDGVEQDGVDNAVMFNTAPENTYRLNDFNDDDDTIFAGYAGYDEKSDKEPYTVYEAEDAILAGSSVVVHNDNSIANCSNERMVGRIAGANGKVTFTVNVETAGEKILKIYHCSAEERKLSVVVNDKVINDNLVCAVTPGWHTPTQTPNELVIELKKGENTIVLACGGNVAGETGDAPNLDKIEIVDIQTEIYEAEEAVISDGANDNNNGLVGNIGINDGAGAVTFNLEDMKAGERILKVYYAQAANRQITVKVNDNEAVAFNCNNTGSWDNLVTAEYVTMNITLTEGINKIKIAGNGGFGPNIDKIEIVEPKVTSYDALDDNVAEKYNNAHEGNSKGTIGFMGGDNNGTIVFTVNVKNAGAKRLKVYYAQNATNNAYVTINENEKATYVLQGEDTDGYDEAHVSPIPLTQDIELVEGNNTIKISGVPITDANGNTTYADAFNIDRIEIVDWDARIASTAMQTQLETGCAFNIYRVKSELYATKVIPEFDSAGNITNLESGKYVIVNCKHNRAVDISDANLTIGEMSGLRLAKNHTSAVFEENYVSNTTDSVVADAMVWTITDNEDGTYYIQDEKGRYMYITFENNETSGIAYEGQVNPDVTFAIRKYTGTGDNAVEDKNAITLGRNSWNGGAGDLYLNATGADATGYFGGWGQIDPGNAFVLYKISDTAKNIDNMYDEGKLVGSNKGTGYTLWNYSTSQQYGDRVGTFVYDGLVENQLKDGLPVFTVPQAGVFDSNEEIKDIYSNIGIPFAYDDGYYVFDSSEMGAVVSKDGNGELKDDDDLVLLENPQQRYNNNVTESIWAPFDRATTENDLIQGNAGFDYHFGMNMTIPFTMTKNGRVKENGEDNDKTNKPITFEFSGDDDVWIFIDGHLVLDLGGIHGKVGGSINFEENTWKLGFTDTVKNDDGTETKKDITVLNFNENTPSSGKIFDDDEGKGRINQTRESFASTDNHEVQIFYLERGRGASNCKIKFNLPMKDNVSVTKKAERSIVGNKIDKLTPAEQQRVNNVNFGFILYKKTADATEYVPVTNTNYDLIDADGKYVTTASTDASGLFRLHNGMTARFTTEIPQEGVSYYVLEQSVDGFSKTQYTYAGSAEMFSNVTNEESEEKDIDITKLTTGLLNNDTANIQSNSIKVAGNEEKDDSLQFICENYLDASMEAGTVYPQDDIIVIDYGLGVNISPLINDVYRGESIKLVSVSEGKYGTATIANDVISYKLNKQLTEIEILDYGVQVDAGEPVFGKVYIIPATSMYYEEDFGNMVTYTDGKSAEGWKVVGTSQTAYQEPGMVGTIGDSPYGSDMAYLTDGGDSNGSSMYVDTTAGAAQFSYSFTGTGTAFFTRTNNTAAYMRVVLTRESRKNLIKDTQWELYTGSNWAFCNGTLTQTSNNVVGNFKSTGGGWDGGEWGVQPSAKNIPVTAGNEYTYSVILTADKDMTMRIKVEYTDTTTISYESVSLKAGEPYKYTTTFTPERDAVNIVYALGAATAEEVVENVYFTLANHRLVNNNDENLETETIETVFRNNIYKNDGTLYNIPVYNIEDLEYGTYTVTVTISKKILNYGNEFWLDGIRVYNPLGTGEELVTHYPMANSAYSTDGEANNTVVTVRDKLLNDVTSKGEDGSLSWTGANENENRFILFTDEYGEMTSAEDYKSYGPKEEVYLNSGQSISFTLANWDPNTNRVYLGMKAPKGTGVANINGTDMTLNNAADCYYVINPNVTVINGVQYATFVIKAEEGSLISLTNIKVTGNAQFAIYNKE